MQKGKPSGTVCMDCGHVVTSFECKGYTLEQCIKWYKDPGQRDFRKQFRDAVAILCGQAEKKWNSSSVRKFDKVGMRLEVVKIFISDEDFVQKYLVSLRDLEHTEITKLINPEGNTAMEGITLGINERAGIPDDMPWYWATLYYDSSNVLTENVLQTEKELRPEQAKEILLNVNKTTQQKRSASLQDPQRRKNTSWDEVMSALTRENATRDNVVQQRDQEEDEQENDDSDDHRRPPRGGINLNSDLVENMDGRSGARRLQKRRRDPSEP